jgi:hypothetical protein
MTGNVSVSHLIEDSLFCDAHGLSKEAFINRHFDEIDASFIAFIMANGIPGCICYDPDEDTVYDGHKRIILAWLMGFETIEYVFGEPLSFNLEF